LAGIKGEYIYDEEGNIIGATGGLKTAMVNKQKYGKEWYKTIGKRGGQAKVPKGFAVNRELAAKSGRVGGLAKVPKGFAVNREFIARNGKLGGLAKKKKQGV
jgi:general stress protein YciG